MKNNKSISSYLLVSPYLLHIIVFVLFPVGFSLFLSFHEWNIISPMKYVGLSNYQKLLQDQYFLKSLRNTLVFLGIHIPLQISIALGLAVILNQKLWFRAFFRGRFLYASGGIRCSGDDTVAATLWLRDGLDQSAPDEDGF